MARSTPISETTQTRTRVMLSSDRLRMIMVRYVTRWWFGGHPPAKCHQLERMQERFHEYRALFNGAERVDELARVLYPKGRGRPDGLSFERALRILGYRLVRLDSVLSQQATGYIGPDCKVHRYQHDHVV